MTWIRANRPWGSQQFGFSEGVGTEDALLCLETLAGHCTRRTRLPLFANFIDLQRAFPSMLRSRALCVLNEMGVPYELLRAFAATFSGNTCRLRINGKLTEIFFVNRGTKEGGINSPSIFNTVYASLLKKLGVTEYPTDSSSFDPNAIYYLVFADDLVLLGANLTKLEEYTNKLDQVLAEVGMKVNSGKSKWMAYLPSEVTLGVSLPDCLGIRHGNVFLENVESFRYLGFHTTWNLSPGVHIKHRLGLLNLAARMAGKLMRSLEISNLRSLRAYFYSLVNSQLYSLGVYNFPVEDFNRAQKVFIQETFNLPKSFPILVACFLLGIDDLALQSFDARHKFFRRVIFGQNSDASLSAMLIDRESLLQEGLGWNAGFISMFNDLMDLHDDDLSNEVVTLESRHRLEIFLHNQRRNQLLDSNARFLLDVFPSGYLPSSFASHLGSIPFESTRVVILFLANLMQRTYLRPAALTCPFCTSQLSSIHLFNCSQIRQCDMCNWQSFIRDIRNQEYQNALDRMFLALQRWNVLTNHFQPGFEGRVDEYFEATNFALRRRNSQWATASYAPYPQAQSSLAR